MESDNSHNSLIPINIKLNMLDDIIRITEKLKLRGRIYVPFLKRNGKYIYVDADTLAPLETENEFDYAELFNDQLAIVGINGNFNIYNKFGKCIFNFGYKSIRLDTVNKIIVVEFERKFELMDLNGKALTDIKYDNIGIFKFGVAKVVFSRKYGFIDKYGNEIIPCIYNDAKLFSNSYLLNASVIGNVFKDGLQAVKLEEKFGYINRLGETIIQFKYDKAFDFENGLACVILNSKIGFINMKGDEIIPCIYDLDYWAKFGGKTFFDTFMTLSINQKKGVLNNFGKIILQPLYDEISRYDNYFISNLVNTENDITYEYRVFNLDGYEILNNSYDSLNIWGVLFLVKKKGKWGIINDENIMLVDFKYTYVDYINNDLLIVKMSNKSGIMNKNLELIVPCIYESILLNYYSNCDYFRVKYGNKWGVISVNNDEVIPIIYEFNPLQFGIENVDFKRYQGIIYNGIIWPFQKDGKWGLVNNINEIIIPFTYDHILPFSDLNLSIVVLNNKYGILDFDGKIILNCIYDSCFFLNGFIIATINGISIILKMNGELLNKIEYHESVLKTAKEYPDKDFDLRKIPDYENLFFIANNINTPPEINFFNSRYYGHYINKITGIEYRESIDLNI